MSYQAGIIGGAGFAGIECARILLQHPDFEIAFITSDAYDGETVASHYPAFYGQTDLKFCSAEAELPKVDVVFMAVPHTVAQKSAPEYLNSGAVVVDLSADFRLKDADVYEEFYGVPHEQRELLAMATFGQPELEWEALEKAAQAHEEKKPVLVACAGCYPTATSLAAAPAIRGGLAAAQGPVIVDAISGVTGAGKKASERTHFCFANENVEAYGLVGHRHTPEMEQILGIPGRILFTPHLAPLNRGLLSTVNIPISPDCKLETTAEFVELYQEFYEGSTFVEVLPEGVYPKTSSVAGSNRAQIGVAFDPKTRTLIAMGAIDNLCKGAAGQAVQCANIVFGLPEDAGLENLAMPV